MNECDFKLRRNTFLDIIRAGSEPSVFSGNAGGKRGRFYKTPVLYSRGRISHNFFTEDSKLYVTPREQKLMDSGRQLNRSVRKWDSLSSRIAAEYEKQAGRRGREAKSRALIEKLDGYYARLNSGIAQKTKNLADGWSLKEAWNFSIIGAILLGMISMSFIYKYLGSQAAAESAVRKTGSGAEMVLGESTAVQVSGVVLADLEIGNPEENPEEAFAYIEEMIGLIEKQKKDEYEQEIREMVKGYPIEKMIPYIMEKDKTVAAFLIGIAKKESNWGKRVPVLNGRDCYNYWGYRGIRKLMGTGGHTCFNSRQDAVDTVAGRLEFLISNHKLDTPAKMIIWKCGSACHKDDQAAVRKWISDVDMYFDKLSD